MFESPLLRPVIGSAFTAYVPGKSGSGSGANTRALGSSPAKQYTGLDNLRSRTSYLTSLGAGEERSVKSATIFFSFHTRVHYVIV